MIYEELEKLFASVGTGMKRVFVEDENGYNRLTTEVNVKSQALGPSEMFGAGAKPDIYALSQAAGAPVTETEVGGTMAGFVPGKVAGVVGAPGDITALATGLYKAAFPDQDEGRLDAFIAQVEDVSNKFGSGATLGFLDDWATQSGISEEAKQGFLQGAEVGSFFGFGQGAKATGKGVVAAGKAIAEGAPARLENAKSGVTLGMGADPTQVIDEAIVGAQKALQKPTKENPVTAVAPTETEPGIIAFHGSGADFDQFSLEKIGTGEGAQAYGYGLYFTDSEDIAKFYKDAITDPGGVPLMYKGKRLDTPWTDEIEERFADELAGLSEGEKNDFITVLANLSQINLKSDALSLRESSINRGRQQRIFDKIIDDVEQPDLGEGKMYKVGLAPNPDDMLDWNKFLSEQPKILDKIKNLPEIKTLKERGADLNEYPGFRIYQILQDSKGVPRKDKAASDQLASVGVEGIKYRAAGSRAANLDAADVEMNYVIFDDKAIKILEKYGIVGPVAITALGAAKQEGEDDANST